MDTQPRLRDAYTVYGHFMLTLLEPSLGAPMVVYDVGSHRNIATAEKGMMR
jgi:hypothetical protein